MAHNINEEQFTQIVEHLIRIDKSRDIDKTFNRLQKNKLTLSISISRKRFPSHTVDATKRANSIV